METKLEVPVASGAGRASNFSSIGNETSTASILFFFESNEGTLWIV